MAYPYQPPKRISDVKRPAAASPTPTPSEPYVPDAAYASSYPEEYADRYRDRFVLSEEPETLLPPGPAISKVTIRRPRRALFFVLAALAVAAVGLFAAERRFAQDIQASGERGFLLLEAAVENVSDEDFVSARRNFAAADAALAEAEGQLRWFGGDLLKATAFMPGLSRAASGKHLIEGGRHVAAAGPSLVTIAERLAHAKNSYGAEDKISFLALLRQTEGPLDTALSELSAADQAFRGVALSDLPAERREQFLSAESKLSAAVGLLTSYRENERVLTELIGGNGPRKYLFLFQNNHELRPTGGFIGTYALLDMNDGVIRDFYVDGIFNPDGQLKENIVPPKPIQKVSAGWSLHDSNWFPDFPTSAEKAIFFFEKTGGPTVDGVVTVTPAVLQSLLEAVGPVELPDYGLTVTSENFMPVIQTQVEVDYDKEENRPKAVIGDLAEELFARVFAAQDERMLYRIGNAVVQGLNRKDILLYARDDEAQALIDESGWSGRLLSTGHDYLSVVHANINGYKTDGVIDETIEHASEIGPDGSVIDTVRITRVHNGGETPYEWWNKVNADYLRVYVPEGSQLISASGMTWEFPEPPLDYAALGFRRDETVEAVEASERVDEETGTRIGAESGKTVFGNWVYVSPGESVTVEYRYRLPFKVDPAAAEAGNASFSVLYQKQAGTPGSVLKSRISVPADWEAVWQSTENLVLLDRSYVLEDSLETDVFVGLLFGKKP